MGQVFLALRAEGFEQFGIRHKAEADANRDRHEVRPRIVDRDAGLQMPEIAAPEALRHTHGFTARMPDHVQGAFVVEADGFDHERVSHPLSHRIAKPARLRVFRELAAVGEDLAEYRVGLVEKQRGAGRLDDFVRDRKQVRKRQTGRGTKRRRLSAILGQPPECGSGFRLKRLHSERNIGKEVEKILRRKILAQAVNVAGKQELPYLGDRSAFRLPDAGKVRLAIGARRGRREVRPAVLGPRRGGIAIRCPLGVDVERRCEERQQNNRVSFLHGSSDGLSLTVLFSLTMPYDLCLLAYSNMISQHNKPTGGRNKEGLLGRGSANFGLLSTMRGIAEALKAPYGGRAGGAHKIRSWTLAPPAQRTTQQGAAESQRHLGGPVRALGAAG